MLRHGLLRRRGRAAAGAGHAASAFPPNASARSSRPSPRPTAAPTAASAAPGWGSPSLWSWSRRWAAASRSTATPTRGAPSTCGWRSRSRASQPRLAMAPRPFKVMVVSGSALGAARHRAAVAATGLRGDRGAGRRGDASPARRRAGRPADARPRAAGQQRHRALGGRGESRGAQPLAPGAAHPHHPAAHHGGTPGRGGAAGADAPRVHRRAGRGPLPAAARGPARPARDALGAAPRGPLAERAAGRGQRHQRAPGPAACSSGSGTG